MTIKMVVDMELQEARNHVFNLMKKKDELEAELKNLQQVLTTNHVGMEDALVDSEGFPRSDIDVYQVRLTRHKIICLQNDYKALMNQIEQGLIKVHAASGYKCTQLSPAPPAETTGPIAIDDFDTCEAFLRVNLVSPGSPAELAGIMVDDLIMEFGSVNAQNFKGLKDIGVVVESSRYKPIIVKVKRSEHQNIALTLTPRPWAGKGLLGCNVLPLETVER